MHPILDPICILKNLIGQEVVIVTPDKTFRGVLALITVKLISLCLPKGVVLYRPQGCGRGQHGAGSQDGHRPHRQQQLQRLIKKHTPRALPGCYLAAFTVAVPLAPPPLPERRGRRP